MGLDMYLSKRTYVGNNYRDKDEMLKIVYPKSQEKAFFKIKKGAIKTERISEIIEKVAYWRKANQVHNWFVQNVQDGEDDCKEYYVYKEQLEELVNACKKDIEYFNTLEYETKGEGEYTYKSYLNIDTNKLNLESKSGFFFGSTNYDEYYVSDLKHTIEQLEPLLEEEGEFYYQSSW